MLSSIMRRPIKFFSSFQPQEGIGHPHRATAAITQTDNGGNVFTPPGRTLGIAKNRGARLEDGVIGNGSP